MEREKKSTSMVFQSNFIFVHKQSTCLKEEIKKEFCSVSNFIDSDSTGS